MKYDTLICVSYSIVKDDDRLIGFPALLPVRPMVGDWIQSIRGNVERKVTRTTITERGMIVELDNPFWRPPR